jgi:hypothetical protein
MISHLRRQFNVNFTTEKYRSLLNRVNELSGTHVEFRIAETPCFFPKPLIEQMAQYGRELIEQLVSDRSYCAAADAVIPELYNVQGETSRPLFAAADFGLVRDEAGNLLPKLVEIQGFPSLYAYQVLLSQQYVDVFGLDGDLQFLLGGLDLDAYYTLLRKAIVGKHDPENVILMEIDPFEQKTLIDFILTKKVSGIEIVNITDVIKEGRKLFYRKDGKNIPVHRIYNRAIVDELVRKSKPLPFRLSDELDLEWAGHPNWFFRISKFSIPYLHHECVPQTWFLHEIRELPDDLSNYVLKPLFSFAGLGVIVGPTEGEIQAIPSEIRSQYILQQRMNFEPVIETPHGPTKAEIRVLYIWLEELLPALLIIRMGRGKMMGVDHNKNMEWVGSSAGFVV